MPRVVVVDVPHHLTQRGNARRRIFDTDADRLVYLDLLRRYCSLSHVPVLSWCLMTNHVHLVATPHREDSFALALRHSHGRHAEYLNARQAASGHVWQGRFFSCALGPSHLWIAMRYVELNPVRAGMVTCPRHTRGPARRRTVAARICMDASKWRLGAIRGTRKGGGNFWPPEVRKRISRPCAAALTPAGQPAATSLSRNWSAASAAASAREPVGGLQN